MSNKIILPLTYLPPISHYGLIKENNEVIFDIWEHFHKQYFYNRCIICGPNGPLKLIIPIVRKNRKMALKDVKISYHLNWRILHWRSLEASYRRSPYFEFYEDLLLPLFTDFLPEFLIDWNIRVFETINKILNLKITHSVTEDYCKEYTDDFRKLASPAETKLLANGLKYHQVFEEKHGFLPDLSIVDLLFCEGNHATEYLSL